MSLEQAIQDNTDAVNRLIYLLVQPKGPSVFEAAITRGAQDVAAATVQAAQASATDFEDLKDAFFFMCDAKGKESARALLSQLSLTKLSDATPDTFEAVLAAIKAAT